MSGGAFDYQQYNIGRIADDIEQVVLKNGVKKTPEQIKEESWRDDSWYEKYPEAELLLKSIKKLTIIK